MVKSEKYPVVVANNDNMMCEMLKCILRSEDYPVIDEASNDQSTHG